MYFRCAQYRHSSAFVSTNNNKFCFYCAALFDCKRHCSRTITHLHSIETTHDNNRHWNRITLPKDNNNWDAVVYIKKNMYYWTKFMTRADREKQNGTADTKYICLNVFLCFIFIDCFLSFTVLHLRLAFCSWSLACDCLHFWVERLSSQRFARNFYVVNRCAWWAVKIKNKKHFTPFFPMVYILPLCYCSLNLHIYTCTDGRFFFLFSFTDAVCLELELSWFAFDASDTHTHTYSHTSTWTPTHINTRQRVCVLCNTCKLIEMRIVDGIAIAAQKSW